MFLSASIIQLDAKQAVVGISKTKQIALPISVMPKNCQINDTIYIEILNEQSHEKRRRHLAKAVLDEILSYQPSKPNAKTEKEPS